ncbi:hypothetical protein TeGR_g8290, partial [Tetraparma gracilis]
PPPGAPPPPPPTSSEHRRLADSALRAATDSTAIAVAMSDYRAKKHLLLDMALSRDSPRATLHNPRAGLIRDGFFWGSYPALERVLRASMDEYYELSTAKRQSKEQQVFNNRLVTAIRAVALSNGWAFDPATFDDKKIRDRIRCFFKTHIQNAKKRLKTVVKNEHKKSNRLLVLAAKEPAGKLPRQGTDPASFALAAAAAAEAGLGMAIPMPPAPSAAAPGAIPGYIPGHIAEMHSDAAASVMSLGFSQMSQDEVL